MTMAKDDGHWEDGVQTMAQPGTNLEQDEQMRERGELHRQRLLAYVERRLRETNSSR